MKPIRAFIALPIASEDQETLAAVRSAAPNGAPVRWLPPTSLHLTLKFLGDVTPDRMDALGRALAAFAWEGGPFRFTLGGVGAFPSLARPNVLWVGVAAGVEPLVRIAGAVDRCVRAVGFPRERRRFTPHLTIGRVKATGEPGWADRFAAAARLEPIEVAAESFVLYQSELLPCGARHTPLQTVPLRVS